MDSPPTAQPVSPKLPWTAPTVTRVPIVSHTQGRAGSGIDASAVDDSIAS